MKQRWLLILCLVCLALLHFRFFLMNSVEKYKPPSPKKQPPPMSTHQTTTVSPSTVNSKFTNLLRLIDWPGPPSSLRHYNFSTSPNNCNYDLLSPREVYRIGEKLKVIITARDHNGQPKQYGGDFFRAKLHSPELKAGVPGQVKDYNNGTYLVTLLLSWLGEAQVQIRLIHSSEAVDILKRKRESHPEKVYFHGYFELNGTREVMECNLRISGKDVCTYKDPATGNIWQCVRPRKLPCDSWLYHSFAGYHKVTNEMEDALLSGSVTNKIIPGSVSLNVTSGNSSVGLTSNLSICRSGQVSPQPSGFYYADKWTSLSCLARHFPEPADALACLKGKDINMVGDSTIRQWFEYLEKFIPSLKKIDQHIYYPTGPLLAVDADAGLVVRYRSHGLPLKTFSKAPVSNLHYDSAHLAGITGGPHAVVVITLCPHFAPFPVRFYLERLEKVRQAVASLLFRSPETTVIIKSANTGLKILYINDWLTLQLDILLRAAFKGMGVTILDVWDMTTCHYLPDNIHPGPPVIKNEVDLMLSYICPK